MEKALVAGFMLLVAVFVVLFIAWAALITLGWFIVWIYKSAENAELADRYRNQQNKQTLEPPPLAEGFTITYKSGKKVVTVQVPADTEAQAVAQAMKLAIPFDKILGVTKN